MPDNMNQDSNNKNEKTVFFFIGTEAEFIKVFPVIIECRNIGLEVIIIASGQNNVEKSRLFQLMPGCSCDVILSDERNIKKSAAGLLSWFINTRVSALKTITKIYSKEFLNNKIMVVHGDTVSTYMGASIARSLNMRVCHVEAGLRSHNVFNPFPEEIDRMLTSRLARYHFAPGDEPEKNLSNAKGEVINTKYNTLIDSLSMSKKMDIENDTIKSFLGEDYFVFVMHRQENLMNKAFFKRCIEEVEKLAESKKCVMILHTPTKVALDDIGKLKDLQNNNNFILIPRTDYFDFMKVLENSKFVITDGGSNQEELSYMGKPALIMRKTTERNEGLGENAVMYEGDVNKISEMGKNYKSFMREVIMPEESPSVIIANRLLDIAGN